MAKDPAFLFYYQDFLVGTDDMSLEQVGAYIRCLCHQASKGSITEQHMKKICETHDSHMIVSAKFVKQEDGTFCNARLSHEMNKRKAYSESRRQNRLGKGEEDMNNISDSYVQHMENENTIKDRGSIGGVGEKEEINRNNPMGLQEPNKTNGGKTTQSVFITEIVSYLNERTKSSFTYDRKDTVKRINGRLNEGFTVDDFKKVIDVKTAEWTGTDYAKFLNPMTLFAPSHFEDYLQQAIRNIHTPPPPKEATQKERYESIIATIGPDTSKEDIAFAYDYQRKTGNKEQYGGKWIMERNHPLTIEVYQEQTYGHIPAHMR